MFIMHYVTLTTLCELYPDSKHQGGRKRMNKPGYTGLKHISRLALRMAVMTLERGMP